MKTEFDLPENTPAWVVWLVGKTERATKVRMAISMLVVFVTSIAFVGLVSFQADHAVRTIYANKCPFDAAGWTCSLPTDGRNQATCFKNTTGKFNPLGEVAMPLPGALPK